MINELNISPHLFLENMNSLQKTKRNASVEQLNEVLRKAHQLNTLDQKGLFIMLVAELSNRLFINFHYKINKLKMEMFPIVKIPRNRTSKNQDEENWRQQKRKNRKNKNIKVVGLQEMIDDSMANSSNVQPPTNNQIRATLVDPNAKKDDDSKGSNPNSKNGNGQNQINFAEQISKFDQQITDFQQVTTQFDQPQSDHSQTNSSHSNSQSGMISNLSQKLKIIGDASFEVVKRTNKRNRLNTTAVTKRKGMTSIIDQHISLDDTKATISRHNVQENNIEYIKARHNKRDEQFKHKIFDDQLQTVRTFFQPKIFNQINIDQLRIISDQHKRKKHSSHGDHEQEDYQPNEDITNFTTEFNLPDSALSQFSEIQPAQFEEANPEDEKIELNIFRNEVNISLTNLAKKTQISKGEMFMKLLWGCRAGDIMIQQQNPETFGQIIINRA